MSETTASGVPPRLTFSRWVIGLAVAAVVWVAAYASLTDFADAVVAGFGLERGTHFAEAVHFFFYDTPKVLLLLVGIVFLMGVIQTFFSPERTRALLSGKRLGVGNVLAASLGIVTPFCSCSAVPLFIGFLSAGVPMGVTFSFLISAPMVNEVALALLFGMFGWQVAAMYLGLGLAVAIVAGYVIGELKMERHLEDWVRAIHAGEAQAVNGVDFTWVERFEAGGRHVKEIVGKVWPYVMAGIGLIGKGAALGTVLAFMMAVIALSAPEMIILRKVLKPTLIATFAGVVAAGILLVGYVFNAVL